jgi:hypothetical protein
MQHSSKKAQYDPDRRFSAIVAEIEISVNLLQQFGDDYFFSHDDILWLAHGCSSGPNRTEDNRYADTACLSICRVAFNGSHDVYPDNSGDISGYYRTGVQQVR